MANQPGEERAWWSAAEAITWIAFRCFVPGGHWPELEDYRPSRDWHTQQPLEAEPARLSISWVTTAPALLAALTAVPGASNNERRLSVQAAKHLMNQTGLSADQLAAELREDLAKVAEAEARLREAEHLLVGGLDDEKFRARGQPERADAPSVKRRGPPENIPSNVFGGSYPLSIDLEGDTVPGEDDYSCQLWSDVEIEARGLRAHFPASVINHAEHHERTTLATRQRKSGLDYRESDSLLVDEAIAMINNGRARNAMDAAVALSDRAEGTGSIHSRAKRLVGQIKKHLAAQSTQS